MVVVWIVFGWDVLVIVADINSVGVLGSFVV